MPKRLIGYVTDPSGVPLPGVIVTTVNDPNANNTTTDASGLFNLTAPDSETQVNFYAAFLEGGQPFKTFTIPTPVPSVWNVRLNLVGPVISGGNAPAQNKMKLWPVYAGLGLLAFLLLRKMKKKKSKK